MNGGATVATERKANEQTVACPSYDSLDRSHEGNPYPLCENCVRRTGFTGTTS